MEVVLVQHLFNQDGESWMVNGIDEFISNGILKPMLSSGSYEEYARIYNRAFLTEYTSDEIGKPLKTVMLTAMLTSWISSSWNWTS